MKYLEIIPDFLTMYGVFTSQSTSQVRLLVKNIHFIHMIISRTIVVDFRHRLTVINMNNTTVPIGQIHSFQFICIAVNL